MESVASSHAGGLPVYGHYIDGKAVAPASGEHMPTEDPFTGRAWAHIARGNRDDVAAAVVAAGRAFREADRLAAAFERGDAVRVSGQVERFRGELVAELDDIRALDGAEVDPAAFLPSAYRDGEELQGFLEHLIREVHDQPLRAVVEGVHGAPAPLLVAAQRDAVYMH